MSIYYAFMADTDITTTDAAVGLYNGSLCWITHRPGYNGTPVLTTPPTNPVTSLPQTIWKEGMLSKEGLGSPSYSVDLQDLGRYGTVSDLEVKIKNTSAFAAYIRSNDLWLTRRRVRFYVVVDDAFILWWTGVVDTFSHSERVVRIRCVDVYKDIHREFPPDVVERVKFPNAKGDVIGKPIPVCIGKVTHAKLLNIQELGDRIPAYQASSVDYYDTVATAVQADKVTIDLKTGTLAIAANAWKGMYLVCVRTGPRQEIRIASNLVSASGVTRVVLEGAFQNGTTRLVPTVWPGTTNVPTNVWYFNIANRELPRIVSGRAISQFVEGSAGTGGIIQRYDSDAGEYLDLSPVLVSSSLSNIASTGFPGVTTSAGKRVDEGSSVQDAWGFIKPASAVRKTHSAGATVSGDLTTLSGSSTWPSVDGTALPNLLDKSRSTKYSIIADRAVFNGGNAELRAAFELAIPEQVYRNWEGGVGLYIDFETEFTAAAGPSSTVVFKFDLDIKAKDIFGGTTVVANPNPATTATPSDGTYNAPGSRTHYYIHPKYFGSSDAGSAERQLWVSLDPLFKDWKSLRIYTSLVIEFKCLLQPNAIAHTFRFSINEVVIQAQKKVDVITDDLYTKVIGQTYESTWSGRRTPPDAVAGVLDAAESFFEIFDDGAFEFVDHASWNAALGLRPAANWQVGRQVTERKNSLDYLIELCQHGHFCIVPLPNGKRLVKVWAQTFGGPVLDETAWEPDGETIISDTPISRCFNEFEFTYDHDPGLGKSRRSFFLRNADQASFPLEATLRAGTNIPEWKFWVGGVKLYSKAASLWNLAKIGYNFTKTRNVLRLDLPWFSSNEDWGGDSDNDGPISLAQVLLSWTIVTKKTFKRQLPITTTTLAYTLASPFQFSDTLLATPAWPAWFSGLRLNTQRDVIEVSAIAFPWDLTP